jgi:ketosteroid isomerase-like protein
VERETRLTFDQQAAMAWTLRQGRAVALETFPPRAETLRAAGQDEDVSPPAPLA